MHFERERVRQNAQQATTQDLLDRITAYRAGLEPDAVAMIEAELNRRGVDVQAIAVHRATQAASQLPLADGTAVPCSWCRRPAVMRRWGWQRLWGKLPVFPRKFAYCADHRPKP